MKEHVEQRWFIRRRGETRGPFPSGLVSRYILLGRLSPGDEVSTDQIGWKKITGVPELIPEVMREARRHPEDPEAQEHLEAARRWADDLREPHKDEKTSRGLKGWKAYLAVSIIIAVVLVVPFLMPEQTGVAEPQCEAPPAPGVIWRDCRLAGSNLANADLAGAVLRSADLRASVLRAAYMKAADLSYVDLSLSNLRGANLSDAELIGANLQGADLSEADLSGANLAYADLTGADLTGADLTAATLDHAVWGEGVICMPGSVGECRRGRESE